MRVLSPLPRARQRNAANEFIDDDNDQSGANPVAGDLGFRLLREARAAMTPAVKAAERAGIAHQVIQAHVRATGTTRSVNRPGTVGGRHHPDGGSFLRRGILGDDFTLH